MPSFINSSGLKLNYIQQNSQNSGTPLLFLHGLGQNAASWQRLLDLFPEFSLLALDARGHGQSQSPNSSYRVGDASDDAVALLDHLNIPRCHAIGLSMGGMCSFDLAARHEDRLSSFTVINSGPNIPANFKFKTYYLLRWLDVRTRGTPYLAKKIASSLFRIQESHVLQAEFIADMSQVSSNDYLKALDSMIGWSVKDKLKDIKIPGLIIAGDQDYTPVLIKQSYTDKLAKGELHIIKNSGHGTPLEYPDQVAALIKDFINSKTDKSPTTNEQDCESLFAWKGIRRALRIDSILP